MEQYGKILLIAMPVFLLLIIIEKSYGYFKGINHAPLMDSISSISSGMTNAVKDILGLSIVIISYKWLESHLAIYHIHNNLYIYIVAFITIDFYGYWTHRWAHQINILWNKHAIHHSSEEFNLSCALRQPISNFFNLFSFLLLPAALLGVPTLVIATVLPIHLFLQFWYHTRYINKLGWLEYIIVTPSHHRVHHAINPEYIDKNHSQIFIFWDKLFGTFQQELETVPPVFGITRPVTTWNPIKINFQHLSLLIADAYHADRWVDKFTIWFKPTGWRPANHDNKYPVPKIDNVYSFPKYHPNTSTKLKYWSILQLLITLLFISYLFANIAQIGIPNIYWYGGFVFISIYSYTELMDTNPNALIWETLRFCVALSYILLHNDWFGSDHYHPILKGIVLLYLGISLLMTAYFIKSDFKKSNS